MTGQLKIATCQFAETFDPHKNVSSVLRLMRKAKSGGAEIVHFHEACMSGYLSHPAAPLASEYDWQALRAAMQKVCNEARRLGLWTVVGSSHPLTPPHKPTNCLYLIGPDGLIRDRYDKRFCTAGDLEVYTPGNHFVTFEINAVRCALLICFDLRFPELYRELGKLGVQVIFQSFHNGYMDGPGVHAHIMRQTCQAHAGINYFWMSVTNSSGYFSRWPSVFIQPDGVIAASLKQNRPGLMINEVNTSIDFYDPSRAFRHLPGEGILHNGQAVKDPRLDERHSL